MVLLGKILTQPTGLIIEVVLTEKRFSWEGNAMRERERNYNSVSIQGVSMIKESGK